MKTTHLKQYAPQARQDFIQSITDRAAHYGLTKKKIEPVTEEGDVAIIAGTPFSRKVGDKRKKLESRINRHGFDQVIEAMAYTWFNRLVAIRFMELHGYLGHGYRVLSATDSHGLNTDKENQTNSIRVSSVSIRGSNIPEILQYAEHVDLPGLNAQKVIDLKLDGTKEEELYRMLLIAQCNALHQAMPFLFESIDDETELLLPDNLLYSDSLIRTLVGEIPEEDWQEVEIIGWLYQFYISEKKDEVIGKVVKSEDIPAATQLFTPNWIVKYLVQNSLGRQWMATYPDSSLKAQMEYYIVPAEQTPEVRAKLDEITPDSLNPEELTLLDPACGSGHILVEAYDLLKAIYLERGYPKRDIPRLILEKNLYGLEIDDRAAQLAAFALLMKARADDRRIFNSRVQPYVLSIQESRGLDAKDIAEALNTPILKEEVPPSGELFEEIADEKSPLFSKKNLSIKGDISQANVAYLIDLFDQAKTFGSLIQVPEKLAQKLASIERRVEDVIRHGEMFEQGTARLFRPIVDQSRLLAASYDVVVTNPPYMGTKLFCDNLKSFVEAEYKSGKADLYACFIQRSLGLVKPNGLVGMITIPNWMFLSSFEKLRHSLFLHQTIDSFVHNGRGVFGSDFGSCSFVLRNTQLADFQGVFKRLFDKQGSVASNDELDSRFSDASRYCSSPNDFKSFPGEVVAYWSSAATRATFAANKPLSEFAEPRQGLATSDDGRFVRYWFEVAKDDMCISASSRQEAADSQKKWFPFNKGGPFRRWFGNLVHVVNWENDGDELLAYAAELYGSPTRTIKNMAYYFRSGITWSNVTISAASFRQFDEGTIISHVGPGVFVADSGLLSVLGYANSVVASYFLGLLSPTTHFEVGQIKTLPFRKIDLPVDCAAAQAVELARLDWNSFETSWAFQRLPLLNNGAATIKESQSAADLECQDRFDRMKQLEEENNEFFIGEFGLESELSPNVQDDQITLYRPDREEDIQRLISYAIGCMMGRYSLDEPGLIYAHSGNEGFDSSRYKTFPADEDGIIPLTEFSWFEDDAAHRFENFIATAWLGEELATDRHRLNTDKEEEEDLNSNLCSIRVSSVANSLLQENLKFVAESLGSKRNEHPRDTIRRYLSQGFFKHHVKMYKKRPIYWLFSSGKERGFQALVYLHRYNEGTLARMRTEYVIPLLGKMAARIDHLTDDIAAATSSAHRKRLEKEKDTLIKQRAEVQKFDEILRHYADQRITLDLDDGVKVNYGKFGDLLAEVKAVTGKKPE